MSHAIQKDDTKTFSPTMDHIEGIQYIIMSWPWLLVIFFFIGQQDNKDTEEITSANAKSLNVVGNILTMHIRKRTVKMVFKIFRRGWRFI